MKNFDSAQESKILDVFGQKDIFVMVLEKVIMRQHILMWKIKGCTMPKT